jgi:ankyrin repeat protein
MAFSPPNPLLLHRWNLVKASREWDTRISTFTAQATIAKSELLKTQKREMLAHSKAAKAAYEKAKSGVTMNKRLEMMAKSYENLSFAKQTERAERLKKRLDPMVDGFYKKELSKHIARARAETNAVKGKIQSERAKFEVAQQKNLDRMIAEKDRDIKFQKRNNDRSSDEPFSIHYAATNGEVSRLEVMLTRRKVLANIDVRDPDSGWTALHFAARGGHVDFARILLKNKANVNAMGADGMTPLHLAAGWGTKEVVGLLLQEGADKDMICKQHDGEKTALDIAKQNLRTENAKFIDRWLPVGLGHSTMTELSETPARPYSDEPNQAVQSQLRALDMKMRVSGRDAIGLVYTYAKLANLFREMGRFEEAIENSKRVVELRQHDMNRASDTEAAEKNKAVAEAMNNLGELCFAAGKEHWDDAKRFLAGSVATCEELFGIDDVLTQPPLLNYGTFLVETGAYAEALPLLLRYLTFARATHTSEMGTASMALVPTLDLIAYCCVLMKDFKTAGKFLDEGTDVVAFHCSYDPLGNKHIDMCVRHDKKGFILFCSGDLQGAQVEYYKARDVLESNGREEFDADILRIENNIAVACCASKPVF